MAYWPQDETGGSGSGANPQTPSGAVDGSNTTFIVTGALNNLFVNGSFQTPNIDYTYNSGTHTISFTIAPPPGSVIYAT